MTVQKSVRTEHAIHTTVIKMIRQHKKMGLAKKLLVGAVALIGIGCSSTKVEQARQYNPEERRMREDIATIATEEQTGIKESYNDAGRKAGVQAIQSGEAAKTAIRAETTRATDSRTKAEKIYDGIVGAKTKIDFVAPNPTPTRQSRPVPQTQRPKNDLAVEAYALGRQRVDGEEVKEAMGLGLTVKNKGKYLALEADTLEDNQVTADSNLTIKSDGFTLAGGWYAQKGPITLNFGGGIRYEQNSIVGPYGLSQADDSFDEVRPFVQAGLQIGDKNFLRAQVEQYIGAGNHKKTLGASLNIGRRF